MKKKTPAVRRLMAGFFLSVSAAFLVSFIDWAGWLDGLEWRSYDLRCRVLLRDAALPEEIAVVLIDDASLRMMNPIVGRWPWPRSVHADVVDFLSRAGARTILFDILFTENERVPGMPMGAIGPEDTRLVESVRVAGNVISALLLFRDTEDEYNHNLLDRPMPPGFVESFAIPGLSPQDEPPGKTPGKIPGKIPGEKSGKKFNNFDIPFTELAAASAGVGIVEFPRDREGVYRSAPLIGVYKGAAFPVLSLAGIQDLRKPGHITLADSAMTVEVDGVGGGRGTKEIPLMADGSFLIKMYGRMHGTMSAYSMGGILASIQRIGEGEIEDLPIRPEELRGKTVFIGASAIGAEDLKPTPLGPSTPGVFLHASILGNILQGDFLRVAPAWITRITILCMSILIAGGVLHTRRPSIQASIPILLAIGYVLACFLLFEKNLVLRMVGPLAAGGVSWIAAYGYLSFTEGEDKKKIKRMLGQYVSPAVLTEVMGRPEEILHAEVGRRERLTILFSDIRGFTSLSETMEAEQVVEILNGYLSGMVDAIFQYDGTLDKFIGDAVMAFWGAPVRAPDHPARAVRAAVEMIRRLERYNEGLSARGLPRLSIGIGIHTADMILGNIGSEKKLDYTVIGDNVNLGSRIEGLTKEYGCRILISETTRQGIGDLAVCRIADRVCVKGRKRPIRIHEVMGMSDDPPEILGPNREVAELTARGFSSYHAGNFDEAVVAYSQILEKRPDDRLARIMHDRCLGYVKRPPSCWEGVHVMETK